MKSNLILLISIGVATCLLALFGVGQIAENNLWQLASLKGIMAHDKTLCIAPEDPRIQLLMDSSAGGDQVARGLAYYCQERLTEACSSWSLVMQDGQISKKAVLRLGLCRETQGDLAGAVKIWEKISSPDQIALYFILKSQQIGLDSARSEAYLQAAQETSPQYCRATDALAVFYIRQSQWDKAEQVIDSVSFDANRLDDIFCVNLLQRKGSVLVHRQEWMLAVPILETVVEKNPNDRDTRDLIGLANIELGHFGEARQVLMEQVQLGWGSYYTYLYLGRSLQGLGENKEAETWYNEAIRSSPNGNEDVYEAHFRLGMLFCSYGRQADGLNELKIAYVISGYSWVRDEQAHCQH